MQDFRTYQRRPVTRQSGYHVSGNQTGSECIVKNSEKITMKSKNISLKFHREDLTLHPLFEENIGIIAFGGYIYSNEAINMKIRMTYTLEGVNEHFKEEKEYSNTLKSKTWNSVGIHSLVSMDLSEKLNIVEVDLTISCDIEENLLEFISFDLDVIDFLHYAQKEFGRNFKQKTYMHIPHIYYLNTKKLITDHLCGPLPYSFSRGRNVVLKSCNRCDRFLPINIEDEINTLAFALHCKKKAPCKHKSFSRYIIKNRKSIDNTTLKELKTQDGQIVSYYGHQLECGPCKKYFVNAALNKMRNPQQFREDSLRRRSIEILVNELMDLNLVHFEFERKTNKEFVRYIWEKFDKKCFKCGKDLEMKEIHIDHTMPLAYLYRLDETATCLCATHNLQKSDSFPIDFYNTEELKCLQQITEIPWETLVSKEVNVEVVELLLQNIEWFFNTFLQDPLYQTVRDGRLTADKIYTSLLKVLPDEVNLIEEFKKATGTYPKSISLES